MTNFKIKIFAAIIILALACGFAFWFSPFRNIETFKSLNFPIGGESAEDQHDIGVPMGDQSADMSETYTNFIRLR